ncbi:MAG: phosphoribosylformylglycinamidine cyclo-ligase [Magnetococcus sp. DMHC-1]|nr:phosphoribosylformylglycinamidine cyclo-ligase [Magnetococcales bacterium]
MTKPPLVPKKVSSGPAMTYRDAGVDIDAGNRLVDMIRGAVQTTRRPEVCSDLGGYGALFRPQWKHYQDPLLVSTTDGVGTKLKLAFLMNRHDTVGIDLVAMSVNDLVVQGAEPLFFLDYFATGRLDPNVAATVIGGIAAGCRQAGCALVGGETAEMPDFYPAGEYDLAGFAVGIVERQRLIDGQRITPGDVVLGLASSGPHSNGYSLIRRLVLPPHGPGLDAPFQNGTLGEALLTPTRIYVRPLLELFSHVDVKGLIHVTGGGFWDNIPRILPESVCVEIKLNSWPMPAVFQLLQELGNVARDEMLRTFNCGIGMIAILPPTDADQALARLHQAGEQAWVIGQVMPRDAAPEQVRIHD